MAKKRPARSPARASPHRSPARARSAAKTPASPKKRPASPKKSASPKKLPASPKKTALSKSLPIIGLPLGDVAAVVLAILAFVRGLDSAGLLKDAPFVVNVDTPKTQVLCGAILLLPLLCASLSRHTAHRSACTSSSPSSSITSRDSCS